MSKIIKICGLDCANCARELEEELEKIEGVKEVRVDFVNQKVFFEGDGDCERKIIDICNNFEEVKVVEEQPALSAAGGKRIKIANLCCANCGRELEEILNGIDGVSATVDFINLTVNLNANSTEAYEKAVYEITHFEDVKIVDGKPEEKGAVREHLKAIISISASLVFFALALVFDFCKFGDWSKYVAYALYSVAFVAAGWQVLLNTGKNLLKGKVFDENFLMTLASLGAIALGIATGDGFTEGVAVMLLYQIGELLQAIAVGSSRRSIGRLMDLKSEVATVIKGGEMLVVSPETLVEGDKILIKTGEKVPVDARLISPAASLDVKSLTGESLPREAKAGDEVLSGSINLSAPFEAVVLREYKNSAVAKILELVENSTAKKAASEKFISKFARYYTPAVVIAAIAVAALVPTFICLAAGAWGWATYSDWIYKALSFLVISCPCALVISVPLSYFCGIGACAKLGVLVKGSTCLDALSKADVAAFDKTGTLTEGRFAIKSYSSERALNLAALAESYSSHPVAAAFNGVKVEEKAENSLEIAGKGVTCYVNGEKLCCGNAALLGDEGVEFEKVESTSVVVYVALGGKQIGYVEIDDKIKDGAAEAIAELKAQGVKRTVMLTGDAEARAKQVAQAVGLDECHAALLPDEKLAKATGLKGQGGLIYVGDGVNDAPVMTVADCAFSMGKVGSDAAIEASDFVIVSDNLSLIADAKRVARKTRIIVYENIIASLAIKLAVMALDVSIPAFPMLIAIFADVGVMLLAVLNALRVKLGAGKRAKSRK